MNSNPNLDSIKLEICPVCQVSINQLGKVQFSSGQIGSRARLYARVCQYTNNPQCINDDPELIGEITTLDKYCSGDNLQKAVDNAFKSQ